MMQANMGPLAVGMLKPVPLRSLLIMPASRIACTCVCVARGANDPRVNVAESDQIVAAMAAKNIPVTYVLFPDEGHGFARPVNNIAFNAVTENFLGQCLAGRAEPIGDTLKASTAQVKHGAEFAPGLTQALQ